MLEAEVLTVMNLNRKYSRTDVLVLSLIFDKLYLGQLGFLPPPSAGDVHQSPTLTAADKVNVVVVLQEGMNCFLNSSRSPHRMYVLFY